MSNATMLRQFTGNSSFIAALAVTVFFIGLTAAPCIAADSPLAADTPSTTVEGATFIAPAGWYLSVRGRATIIESPERDSRIVLVDVDALDRDAAIAAAWAAYRPDMKLPLISTVASADKDGWTDQWTYTYRTSPNERRDVASGTKRRGNQWTVWISDFFQPTAEKRLAQVRLIFDRLLPKGYERETFAGKTPNNLDDARIKEIGAFVERAREALGIPGVSIGLIQNGKVVFAGGFGVRRLGKAEPVDADTLYIIASNTKAMTTLMLGKLVDEGKLTWDTPVTKLLPQFKLGDADTTSKVLVRHLVCACTGLPRQDLEWLVEFGNATPTSALAVLGTMKPTSGFGEMYQYSNPLAAAGGYVGAYVLLPGKELGAAYDEAMKSRVFDPLGMKSTTFDFAVAQAGNHAAPHALSIDAKPEAAMMKVNYAVIPVRPAGGAWSSVNDVLKYVAMELANGQLPDGGRYISKEVLLERRAKQVTIGKDSTYGMGLRVETTYDIPVVQHGGSMIGYKSNMLWLPDHQVGAVILTNSDSGGAILRPFQRKVLEVLFNGRPEADADIQARATAMRVSILAERKLLTVPAAAADAAKLAKRYANAALGEIAVSRDGESTAFDFGEWKSPVASRTNPDGTVSFITTVTGMDGLELVVRDSADTRSLVLRDAQHEYIFTER